MNFNTIYVEKLAPVLVPVIIKWSKMKKLITSIFVISLVIACKKNRDQKVIQTGDSTAQPKTETNTEFQNKTMKEGALQKANTDILKALKAKDYKTFASFIHPEKGITFSMYAFINPKEDKHFSKAEFERFQPTKTLFTWGAHDGSGDAYKATINEYLNQWVFSKDFTSGKYSVNTFQGKGNSLNNLKEMYPKKDFTENYIKGTEKNGEMDWKTIRFVFDEFQGKYCLIAVINDQWTI